MDTCPAWTINSADGVALITRGSVDDDLDDEHEEEEYLRRLLPRDLLLDEQLLEETRRRLLALSRVLLRPLLGFDPSIHTGTKLVQELHDHTHV